MIKKLKPTYIFDRLDMIPLELLKEQGIKGIFLDVDNTIMDSKSYIDEKTNNWIREAKKQGFILCILSNSLHLKKIKGLMNRYEIYGIGCAKKPLKRGFIIAQNIVDLKKEELIIIGDQIFSDVWGANRFGIKSIYTHPINKRESIFTRVRRPLERAVLRRISK